MPKRCISDMRPGLSVKLDTSIRDIMPSRFPRSRYLLGLALWAATAAQASNIVSDGGFEVPAPGTMGAFNDGSPGIGWLGSGALVCSASYCPGAVPHSGNQFVYLDLDNLNSDIFQQVLSVPGVNYTFSFWVADGGGGGDNLQVDFGNIVVFSTILADTGVSSASDYVNYTFNSVALSGLANLEFEVTPAGPSAPPQYTGVILDDISVTPIPEPQMLALAVLGVVALFAIRRRRVPRRPGAMR
jgi:MYXO-CTERM domain-containing protein